MKPVVIQVAMRRHFSQSGAGAFDGQHGMLSAIWSIVVAAISDVAKSCDMAAIAPAAGGDSAMTGRDKGANARPAIIKIATN